MKVEQWPGLGPGRAAQEVFEAGILRTVETAGSSVVGIPRSGDGDRLLGTAASREEAAVIATTLRLCNPD